MPSMDITYISMLHAHIPRPNIDEYHKKLTLAIKAHFATVDRVGKCWIRSAELWTLDERNLQDMNYRILAPLLGGCGYMVELG